MPDKFSTNPVAMCLKPTVEMYHAVFENMQEGYAFCKMLYDGDNKPTDWIYLDINKAFEGMVELENITGRKATEITPYLKESNPELFEIFEKAVCCKACFVDLCGEDAMSHASPLSG